MNLWNSSEKPVDKPNLTEALLKAADNLPAGATVEISCAGMSHDDWAGPFNRLFNRKGDFSHVDKHITVKVEDDCIVLTNVSAPAPAPAPAPTPEPTPESVEEDSSDGVSGY